MNFSEKAEELRLLRLQHLGEPEKVGFELVNGVMTMTIVAHVFVHDGSVMKSLGPTRIFYMDQNPQLNSPKGKTSEAQLVRAQIWQPYEVGWLTLNAKGEEIWLAKVNPREQVDLELGWITAKGEIVLRR